MSLGSRRRNLSFDILSTVGPFDDDGDVAKGHRTLRRSNSDPVPENGAALPDDKSSRRKRKHKSSKRKKSMIPTNSASSINPIAEEDKLLSDNIASDEKFREMGLRCDYSIGETSVVCDEVIAPEESAATVCEISYELRRRSVNGRAVGASEESASALRVEESEKEEVISRRNQRNEPNGKLENAESLDWERLMVEDPNYPLLMGKSSVKHFMEQMYRGNSLRSTITIGTEEERKRVYDTIFRLPWRCELLIDVGFFVCLNSFLSLLTIMPIRNLMALWKVLTRQFNRPPTTELSDFGCLIVLACGVMLLGQTDISLIYHMIRGQGTIKLYVVYNVLEIFDKLWQSFGGDVLETLFYSADGLANCSHESFRYWVRRYIIDLMLAAASSNILQYETCF
ncbi:hypothetical protein Nepgr_016989 [Nepenthes gracilis]|uniref:Uncharacterized protein n=1 Tax=Nepenthes gracilis TaxID=150966 RepID=A0AAD3XS31_NEPGR|nr:hypothetical protein Nepgr_016989 [Nepenthes gracilis]